MVERRLHLKASENQNRFCYSHLFSFEGLTNLYKLLFARRDMKRGLFIGLIGFILLGSFVLLAGSASSASCGVADDSQLIMKLYDNGGTNTNTHAEFWNGIGGYTTEICFNNIFGYPFTGANPHNPNGENRVIRLSASTNAHAEIPSGNTQGYLLVYYGDLYCAVFSNVCPSDKKEIVRLSANTNAHLGLENTNYNNVIICCRTSTAPPPPHCTNGVQDTALGETGVDCGGSCLPCSSICGNGALESGEQCDDGNIVSGDGCSSTCTTEGGPTGPRAYWAGISGTEYAAGAQVNLWSTVKLVARGATSGNAITFNVRDNDCISGSPPCAGDDLIVTLNANAGADGSAEYNWTIDQNSYTLGGGGSGGEGNNLELYFIATATGYTQQSNVLNVLDNVVPPSSGMCGDYTTETTCDEDQNNYAANTQDPRYQLNNCSDPLVDCYCDWEGSASPNCILKGAGTGPANPITPALECLWECSYPDYTSGVCSGDLMDISANAIFAENGNCAPGFGGDDVGCIDQTTSIMCGAPELSMPFFGAGQFVMSIITVMGIYVLIGLKRKK